MRTQIITGVICTVLIAAVPAFSATPQQEKMKSCNTEATSKQLKGDDRKTYMKSCLSATSDSSPKVNSQQEKMKSCNADAKAKGLAGADRKAFMKTCLSGG